MRGLSEMRLAGVMCVRHWFVVLMLGLLVACGGGANDVPNRIVVSGGTALLAIEVSPAISTLAPGTSVKLVATGVFSDGSTRDYSDKVSWRSTDESVAPAPENGRVSALAKGSTTLTASLLSQSGSTLKAGSTLLTVSNATLSRIEIIPRNPQLAKGLQLKLTALGHFDDGSIQDLTSQVAWATDDATVVPVENTPGNEGSLFALKAGNVTIVASLGTFSTDIAVTVSATKTLLGLSVEPFNPSLMLGTWDQPLTAIGYFSDGSIRDLTQQVKWRSSTSAVVFGNSPATAGQLATQGVGNSLVSAKMAGVSVETLLTVRTAGLLSISVSSPATSVVRGVIQPLTALGHFDDGTQADISSQVIWSSSAPAVLAVSNAPDTRGQVAALGAGTADISAKLAMAGGNIAAGRASLTVTDARLISIKLTPEAPSLAKGTQLGLRASGQYTDSNGVKTTRDITERVSWFTTNPAAAAVSNGRGSRGIVQAGSVAGSTNVTAMLDGVTSGAETVRVVDATLTGLRIIAPATTALQGGDRVQLVAMGDFDVGSGTSRQNLSEQLVWISSDSNLAWVSNADGTRGQVTVGVGVEGPVSIAATRQGMSPATIDFTVSK